MSRSNPQDHLANPAVRWFEWNGELGTARYYDKDAKKNVDVGTDFTFILLDKLASIRGWHDASESSIYSNEVRDTTRDPLIVKSFKGGTLAEGLYREIKDHVTSKAVGGQFVTNCYIAFKHDGALAIGSIRFKGAALGAWMDFEKAHRAEIYKQAIAITGYTEGKKGRIVFRVPVFEVKPLSTESNNQAVALDAELQAYLSAYFKRTTRDQAHPPAAEAQVDDRENYADQGDHIFGDAATIADEVPF
jgi:hypothetical protein